MDSMPLYRRMGDFCRLIPSKHIVTSYIIKQTSFLMIYLQFYSHCLQIGFVWDTVVTKVTTGHAPIMTGVSHSWPTFQ